MAAMEEIITIENFELQLPKFDVNTSGLHALVDIGSNGIRFTISDLSPPHSRLLPCIYRERAGISLYDALLATKPGSLPSVFPQETIDATSEALARFGAICKAYNVPDCQISVFATEAMRTAHNRAAMLAAIKADSGLDVQIMSPPMESLFGAMGARAAFGDVSGLFMDLGGGSVQMTFLDSRQERYEVRAAESAKSIPYGAAKLTNTLRTAVAGGALGDLKTQMREAFEGMAQRFPQLREQAESKAGVSIYLCGGGFRGYGSMLKHTHDIQPYPISEIGGFAVAGDRFAEWKKVLGEFGKAGKVHGISKRRREQFPAIAMVVGALVEAVPRIRQATFCSGGNRDGVLYMKLPPHIREQDPLLLLRGGVDAADNTDINALASLVASALPADVPELFTGHLIPYLIRNTWMHMGASDSQNSARALHNPLSGSIAGLPGLTHEVQAIISLTLCARWGADLGPIDEKLHANLRLLVGGECSFWADYLGAVLKFLATVSPAFPTDPRALRDAVAFTPIPSRGLGKKGKKPGVKLEIGATSAARSGLDLARIFKKVGRGLDYDYRVEAHLLDR